MKLGAGIVEDFKARAPWYVSDWTEGFRSGYRCATRLVISMSRRSPQWPTGTPFANGVQKSINACTQGHNDADSTPRKHRDVLASACLSIDCKRFACADQCRLASGGDVRARAGTSTLLHSSHVLYDIYSALRARFLCHRHVAAGHVRTLDAVNIDRRSAVVYTICT